MKEPERFPADDPREWMNRARSNRAKAKNRVPQAYLEDLCFEAQQAANMNQCIAVRVRMLPCIHRLHGSPSNCLREFWSGVAQSGKLSHKPQNL